MGFLGFGRKKRRERWIRADYRKLPREEWTDDELDHYLQNCTTKEYWAYWEQWSRETYDHPRVKNVKRSCLDLARAASKDSYPQEFASGLRVEGDTVTEIVLIPGTIQGDRHAIMNFWQLPVDRGVLGTLHSHPSPHPYPSDADFELFEKHGMIHIIIGKPFGENDWRAYDHTGAPTHLEVVD